MDRQRTDRQTEIETDVGKKNIPHQRAGNKENGAFYAYWLERHIGAKKWKIYIEGYFSKTVRGKVMNFLGYHLEYTAQQKYGIEILCMHDCNIVFCYSCIG